MSKHIQFIFVGLSLCLGFQPQALSEPATKCAATAAVAIDPWNIGNPEVMAQIPDNFNDGSPYGEHEKKEDIVAILPMTVENFLMAYEAGVFPWRQISENLFGWTSPADRGVIDFADFHISKSSSKFMKKEGQLYELTIDRAFDEVVEGCAAMPRKSALWIKPKFKKVFKDLHRLGYAHSFEVWEKSTGKLVAGFFGEMIKGVFTGESMFHSLEPEMVDGQPKIRANGQVSLKYSDVAKLIMPFLKDYLQAQGHSWVDAQVVSNMSASFGAKYVSREEYQRRLTEAQKKNLPF